METIEYDPQIESGYASNGEIIFERCEGDNDDSLSMPSHRFDDDFFEVEHVYEDGRMDFFEVAKIKDTTGPAK
jgi:hypothetical protein